ncbi:MAG: hypothetical protein KF882_02650 [Bacteroidia bacterium]|nr:hypothetical protein [Bacteroidia bacterium]MCO5253590.1 SNF2 family helicase [Bacteroidota bacterium]
MIQINHHNYSKTQAKFQIVFSLESHPQLGLIIQVQAVEQLASGEFSMNFSKVRIQNAEFYGMSPDDISILKIIEEYEIEKLITLFYKGKKRIKSQEFLEKYCTSELVTQTIRPYLEKKITKILLKLQGRTIYYWGSGIVNQWIPVLVNENQSEVVFCVDRTDNGMTYYAQVFDNKKKVKIQSAKNVVIVNTPAYILIENKIHHFSSKTDARKIATFFNKEQIVVPKASEELYLNKFILPLALTHTLKTKQIEVQTVEVSKQAKINFLTFNSNFNLSLEFVYGDLTYPMHVVDDGKASLEKGAKDWIIKVFKRDKEWENLMIKELANNKINHFQGALFNLPENLSLETFISTTLPALQKKGFIINQDGIKQPFCLATPVLTYVVKDSNDWFDINIMVRFGTVEIPFKKLRTNILNNNNMFTLPDGSIAIIPQEWMQKLSPILDCATDSKDELRIGKYHYGLLEAFDNIGINRSGEKMKSMVEAYNKAIHVDVPITLKTKLRKYQQTGLQWLIALNENNFGGLLADDMGLGKTIQTLAFFEWFILNKRPESRSQTQIFKDMHSHAESERKVPFLVVVPTSLLHNWKNEIEHFTELHHFIYAGNQRNRYIWEYFYDFEVIITTYGTIRNDRDVFGRVKFDAIVFDEAQNLKNQSSITVKAASELNAKQKILLTGTPIENSISDLWSLLNIANPGILGNYSRFQTNFIQKIEKKNDTAKRAELKELVAPFILRRTKEEVAKELPPRHEQIVYCDMEPEQEKLYEKTKSFFRNELLKTISERGMEKSKLHILKGLLRLRQIANHPVLIDENFKDASGKFNIIVENLSDIVNRGNKVLVFSQFVTQLRLFKDKFEELGIAYAYIDGAVKSETRDKEVKKFQESDTCQVFLISLKAGGVGLNLTAADYVFIVDPWWNPAVERQAMDRAHRIGRERPVFVYKYITEKTVEEKIILLQERKKQLANDLIAVDAGTWLANIDKQDVEDILS